MHWDHCQTHLLWCLSVSGCVKCFLPIVETSSSHVYGAQTLIEHYLNIQWPYRSLHTTYHRLSCPGRDTTTNAFPRTYKRHSFLVVHSSFCATATTVPHTTPHTAITSQCVSYSQPACSLQFCSKSPQRRSSMQFWSKAPQRRLCSKPLQRRIAALSCVPVHSAPTQSHPKESAAPRAKTATASSKVA